MAENLQPTDSDADQQFAEQLEVCRTFHRNKVRVRVLAQLYHPGPRQRYHNWRGQLWRLDIDAEVAAGRNFRVALEVFFRALTTVGPLQVIHLLHQACQGALPMSEVEGERESESDANSNRE